MKRDVFKGITLMNMLLCFCVVIIHLTSSPLSELDKNSFWYLTFYTANKMLCFSVPSFIFLSGFKLFNKYKVGKMEVAKFYKRRLTKIVVPYLISVFIYFLYFYIKKWVKFSELPEYVFLGTLVAHFYYVIIAVQLYLLFPILNILFKKFPKSILFLSLICSVYFLEFFQFTYTDRFFGTYIFYFILGMVFAKYKDSAKNAKNIFFIIPAYIIIALIHLSLSYMANMGMLIYRYASMVNLVYVVFSIITIYEICIWLSEKYHKLHSFSHRFGSISYDVYLYHILVIFTLQHYVFPHFNLSVKGKFIVSSVVVFSLIFLYYSLKKKMQNIKAGK